MSYRTFALSVFLVAASSMAHAAQPPFANLYTFGELPDAEVPQAELAIGSGGILYGTTVRGGAYDHGTVFSLTPPSSGGGAWTETVLWSFDGALGGDGPYAGVIVGSGGVLYGVTQGGGRDNDGIAFALTPPASPGGSWTEQVLHNFAGGPTDGAYPQGQLAMDAGGVIYGATTHGGASDKGTIFSLAPPSALGGRWIETVIHSFKGGRGGSRPLDGVTLGSRGTLYGTTAGWQHGTVFAFRPPSGPAGSWTFSTIYRFSGPSDGEDPRSPVSIGPGGILYGTTYHGGDQGVGVIYKLTPPSSSGAAWTETVIHSFHGARGKGALPVGALTVSSKTGALYGTTSFTSASNGSPSGYGTVFELKPASSGAWKLLVLHTFSGTDGSGPLSGLVASGGVLYGVTVGGGPRGNGSVFALSH